MQAKTARQPARLPRACNCDAWPVQGPRRGPALVCVDCRGPWYQPAEPMVIDAPARVRPAVRTLRPVAPRQVARPKRRIIRDRAKFLACASFQAPASVKNRLPRPERSGRQPTIKVTPKPARVISAVPAPDESLARLYVKLAMLPIKAAGWALTRLARLAD